MWFHSLTHFKGWFYIFEKFVFGGIRTGDLQISSPTLYHWATETYVKYAGIIRLWYKCNLCWHQANANKYSLEESVILNFKKRSTSNFLSTFPEGPFYENYFSQKTDLFEWFRNTNSVDGGSKLDFESHRVSSIPDAFSFTVYIVLFQMFQFSRL